MSVSTRAAKPQRPAEARDVASPRRKLDPHSTDLKVRSALHLRSIIDKREMSIADLHRELERAGVEVSLPAVKKWFRGDALPTVPMLVGIASVTGIADYRKVLPPPLD